MAKSRHHAFAQHARARDGPGNMKKVQPIALHETKAKLGCLCEVESLCQAILQSRGLNTQGLTSAVYLAFRNSNLHMAKRA